jgi:hypothetical protein
MWPNHFTMVSIESFPAHQSSDDRAHHLVDGGREQFVRSTNVWRSFYHPKLLHDATCMVFLYVSAYLFRHDRVIYYLHVCIMDIYVCYM